MSCYETSFTAIMSIFFQSPDGSLRISALYLIADKGGLLQVSLPVNNVFSTSPRSYSILWLFSPSNCYFVFQTQSHCWLSFPMWLRRCPECFQERCKYGENRIYHFLVYFAYTLFCCFMLSNILVIKVRNLLSPMFSWLNPPGDLFSLRQRGRSL